jgi:hypothetical protein
MVVSGTGPCIRTCRCCMLSDWRSDGLSGDDKTGRSWETDGVYRVTVSVSFLLPN